MKRLLLLPLVFLTALPLPAEPPKPAVRIALASYRERKLHPKVYFYDHDGISSGKVVGSITAVNQRSDYHPSLSADCKLCAFASEVENQVGKVQFWDVEGNKELPLNLVNDSPNSVMHPSLTGDGKLLAFAAWNRAGLSLRWDLQLYDIAAKTMLDLPGVNTGSYDERMPCLSRDGGWLAYVSNDREGVGGTDIVLFDRSAPKVVRVPTLNSPRMDVEPSLSADGRLVVFVSDRTGGAGGRDVYLFDRHTEKFVPLPDLNSVAHEQSPSLSPDGRFLAFVSERTAGEGERDVYLYDVKSQKLLPTPGLNSKSEDFDPCVITLSVP